MTSRRRLRRSAALSAAVLLGAALPVTVLSAPAHAEDGCLTERAAGGDPIFGIGATRCDDSLPPVTSPVTMSPAPGETGFLNAETVGEDKAVSFTFSGSYTDADTDPITFRCRFNGSTQASDATWSACTSPATYTLKGDTTSQPYTFEVYAIDSADSAINATDATSVFGGGGAETDLPAPQAGEPAGGGDRDQTPESVTFEVDTKAPLSYIFDEPYDPETPSLPMIETDSPQFRITASEGNVSFTCTINDKTYPCSNGNVTFRKLPAGNATLKVTSVDQAGNRDPKGDETVFTVPEDIALPQGKKWKSYKSRKAFGGSYIETTSYGARLAVPGQGVREVRLICTTRPDAGSLKYKVPGGVWQPVKLRSKRIERQAVVILRNTSSKAFTGKLKFKTMSRGKPIALDAIMMR